MHSKNINLIRKELRREQTREIIRGCRTRQGLHRESDKQIEDNKFARYGRRYSITKPKDAPKIYKEDVHA